MRSSSLINIHQCNGFSFLLMALLRRFSNSFIKSFSSRTMSKDSPINVGTPLATVYYPFTKPPVGQALSKEAGWAQKDELPKLFQPVRIGKKAQMEFKNKVFVAPMCQYSCETGTGLASDWHLVHLGALATRGAALIMTEAAAVLPNGRISPEDLGIWSDEHAQKLEPIVKFIKAQGARAGIQLAHAGRKGSTLAPWIDSPNGSHAATVGKAGGWKDVWAPSGIPFEAGTYPDPVEMTLEDIDAFKKAWGDAVVRADKVGFEVLEVHGAHGYLIHNFLSPLSNQRTDQYGGSIENRMRLALEIIEISRQAWPASKPLFLRISATDWHINGEVNEKGEYISWGIEQSKILVSEASKRGVDLVDISSGGNDVKQKIAIGPGYQVPFAEQCRNSLTPETRIPISSVGLITSGKQAEKILQDGQADIITVARELLRDADAVFNWAMELDCIVNVPVQYQRAYTRMLKKS